VSLTDAQVLALAQEGAKKRVEELRQEIARLEVLIHGNGARSVRTTPAGAGSRIVRRRRRLSADARARIAAAQKARWARIKGGRAGVSTAKASATTTRRRRRRGMSAAQRAAVSRRMKAYWAKRRRAKSKKK
jgi:hypothetical protein